MAQAFYFSRNFNLHSIWNNFVYVPFRGHRDRLTDVESSEYSEQSTLRIGESLDNNSSQATTKSRHRRLSGSVAESSITDQAGSVTGIDSTSSSSAISAQAEHGYRKRSLSDSKSNNARSSGKIFILAHCLKVTQRVSLFNSTRIYFLSKSKLLWTRENWNDIFWWFWYTMTLRLFHAFFGSKAWASWNIQKIISKSLLYVRRAMKEHRSWKE